MIRFVGIWFNMDREVKRDYVNAKSADEASNMIHAMYYGKKEPATALTVYPVNGYHSSNDVSVRGNGW